MSSFAPATPAVCVIPLPRFPASTESADSKSALLILTFGPVLPSELVRTHRIIKCWVLSHITESSLISIVGEVRKHTYSIKGKLPISITEPVNS